MATSGLNLGGIFGKIGGIVSGVSGFINKAVKFLKDPVGTLKKGLGGVIDKIAPKLPFGLGKLVAPFAKKFLGSALGWLSKGPLAGVFSLMEKVRPTVEKLSGFMTSLSKLLGGFAGQPKQVKENAAKIAAHAQARAIAAGEPTKAE
jgi:hypothetical protein